MPTLRIRAQSHGWTLVETLVVITLVAIVLALAVPAFRDLVADQRRTGTLNALVRAAHIARSEAHKRGRRIVLCKTPDGQRCGGRAHSWDQGWLVFVNLDRDEPPARDPDEPVLLRYPRLSEATLRANRAAFAYRPFDRRATNGTLTYCDQRGPRAARALIISYTGRPRIAPEGPGGRPLVCP